jgi:hypothetical protein
MLNCFFFICSGPSVFKARRKKVPLLPHSCLFDIPDDYKTTIDGKRFLLADESIVRRERILIYSSDHQLNMLFSSPIVYMDGTFSKSPAHFMQIYIIHAILFDICKQYNLYLKTKLFILGLCDESHISLSGRVTTDCILRPRRPLSASLHEMESEVTKKDRWDQSIVE